MFITVNMIKLLVLTLTLVSFTVTAQPDKIYDPSRDAFNDYQNAKELAFSNHKNIFVIAGGNWCSYCYKFEHNLKDSSLDLVIRDHFNLIKANFGDGNDNEKFFSLFPKITTYPHIMIISPEGKLLESIVPSTESEFRSLLSKYTVLETSA